MYEWGQISILGFFLKSTICNYNWLIGSPSDGDFKMLYILFYNPFSRVTWLLILKKDKLCDMLYFRDLNS